MKQYTIMLAEISDDGEHCLERFWPANEHIIRQITTILGIPPAREMIISETQSQKIAEYSKEIGIAFYDRESH
jgi:hypothetical protein